MLTLSITLSDGEKYILTDITTKQYGQTFYRIQATKNFGNVKKGDYGGWVTGLHSLSQEGNCWVGDDAMIGDIACVKDNAIVEGDATVLGNSIISDNALVCEHAKIFNSHIKGYAYIEGRAYINNSVITDHCIIGSTSKIYDRNIKGYTQIRGYGLITFYTTVKFFNYNLTFYQDDFKKIRVEEHNCVVFPCELKNFIKTFHNRQELKAIKYLAKFIRQQLKVESRGNK